MERIVLRVLIIITCVCSLSAKHVYVTVFKRWWDAQKHCRSNFTDLSPITNELEDTVFKSTATRNGWIGLYGNISSPSGWTWSGGEHATYLDWENNPYDSSKYRFAFWTSSGWHAYKGHHPNHFFCLNLVVVDVRKSWEEALEHCTESNTNLTSLLSETERLLAQKEIREVHITERVWIGLRYLEDRWLWVNKDPLEYQAWSQGGDQDHQCPIQKRCGALTKDGLWENWDCQDKLNFICS